MATDTGGLVSEALALAINDLDKGIICDALYCPHTECTLAKVRIALPLVRLLEEAVDLLVDVQSDVEILMGNRIHSDTKCRIDNFMQRYEEASK